MKSLKILISCCIFALAASSTFSQGTGKIYLESVDGSVSGNMLLTGQPIKFNLAMQNLYGGTVSGFENRFIIYSPDGATWTTTNGNFVGGINTFNMILLLGPEDNNGVTPDFITFSGLGPQGGIPNGFDQVSLTIDIGPLDPKDHLRTICVDSASPAAANAWMWQLTGGPSGVTPGWSGPHCFTVFNPDQPVNTPPTVDDVADTVVSEGETLNFFVTASDPDQNDFVTMTIEGDALPAVATFTQTPGVSGEALFDWKTSQFDAGIYNVVFRATDNAGATDIDSAKIEVINFNQPPVFNLIGDWQVNEAGLLEISVSATDSDDDPIQLGVLSTNVPVGEYSFDIGRSEAQGTFVWQTDFADSGSYFVEFGAYDGKQLSTDTINIAVTNILCADFAVADFTLSGMPSVSKGPNLFSRLSLNLTNNGETDGVDSVFIGLYLSVDSVIGTNDELLIGGREHIGPITLNDIVNTPVGGTIPFTFPDGLAYLGIVLDENETSFECNETNNTAFIPVTVVLNNFPVLNPIPDTTIDEGQQLTLSISGFDTDLESFIFEASNLPIGSSFGDNGDGSATFEWTPGFDQDGIYNVTFGIVDEREGSDEQVVRIVVNDINQPPYFDPLSDAFISEGDTLRYNVVAYDNDGDQIALGFNDSNLPGGAFIDNFDGTGQYYWETGYADGGIYYIAFTADDGKGGVAFDTVEITVFDVNRDPFVVSSTDTTIDEGQPLHFVIIGADSDGDPLTFFLEAHNIESPFTFVDSGNDSAVFDWATTFDDAGDYNLLIYLDDRRGGVVEINISITVNNLNRPPNIDILDFLRAEGDTVIFPVLAFDPDFDNMVLSIIKSDLPTSAVFTDLGFGAGVFNWPTTFGDAGTYYAVFEADDLNGGKDQDSVNFFITSTNRPPVFDPIGDKEVFEDQQLDFTVNVTDPNDDFPISIQMFAPTLPNATFQEDGDVPRGDFSLFATNADIGVHQVIFRADDDNGGIEEDTIFITVKDFNFPPAFQISFDTTISENDSLEFAISAYDDDDDPIVLSISSTSISGGGLIDNGDGTGSFNWRPTYSDQGIDSIIFRATSTGGLFAEDTVQITVLNVNQAPVLVDIDNYTIAEGDTLAFDVFATDVDGDFVTLTVTSEPPSGAVLDQTGSGLGTFSWTPGFFESGFYTFTFTADDGFGGVDVDSAYFIVTNANQPPVLNSVGLQVFTEGVQRIFVIDASDPDGDSIVVNASNLPSGAMLLFGDAPYVDWTPGFDQAGEYLVTLYATDEFSAVDSEVVLFRVSNVNRLPQLDPVNDTVIAENQELQLHITSSDPDGGLLTLDVQNLPAGANFFDSGNGTGSIYWTPDFEQSGDYLLSFSVTDDNEDADFDSAYIIVIDANRPPVLESIGNKLTFENDSLRFFVNAYDADGGGIELIMVDTDLPQEAQFYQILNKDTSYQAGQFEWGPTFGDSGVYTATFVASDGELSDSETITITVSDVACTDLDVFSFTLNGPQQISVDKPFQERLNLSLVNLGPTTVDSSFTLSFYLSDDSLLDGLGQERHLGLEFVAALPLGGPVPIDLTGDLRLDYDTPYGPYYLIILIDQNQNFIDCNATNNYAVIPFDAVFSILPVLDPIGDKFVDEGDTLSFYITASDIDFDPLYYYFSPSLLPGNPTITRINSDSALFVMAPGIEDAGVYLVTFIASESDKGGYQDEETITITVNNLNRPPVLDPIGPQTFFVNQYREFDVTGSDPDNNENFTFYTSVRPEGAGFSTFTGAGGPTFGRFSWQPISAQVGIYTVTFYMTDGIETDSEVVLITVGEVACSDLTVSSFTLDGPQQISYGRAIDTRLNLTIDNLGPLNVDSQVTLNFYYSDAPNLSGQNVILLGSQTLSSVAGGSTIVDVTGPVTMVNTIYSGFAYVIVEIAPGSYVDCDPSNNIGSIPFEMIYDLEPSLDPIGDRQVNEGETLSFFVFGRDGDNDQLEFEFFYNSEFNSAPTLTDSGFNTAYFEWTPSFDDAGIYTFEFNAIDGYDASPGFDQITITVNNVNRPPVLNPIGPQTFFENQYREFDITGSDLDVNDGLEFTTSTLPSGASFFTSSGGHTFAWQPNSSQVGDTTVIFYVNDGLATDSEVVTITVENIPCPDFSIEVFSLDGPQQISYDRLIQNRLSLEIQNSGEIDISGEIEIEFFVSEDSNIANCDCNVEPVGFELIGSVPVGNQFEVIISNDVFLSVESNISPGANWLCAVIDEDNSYGDCAMENNYFCIPINVDYNIPPILDPIGDREVNEGDTLAFIVSAIDWDFEDIYLNYNVDNSCECIDANFYDSGNGHAYFEWIPDFYQAGDYSFEFYVYDGQKTDDRETITIKVNNVNRAPIIDSLPDTLVFNEGDKIGFRIFANDPDDDCFELALVSPDLPPTASFDYVFDCVNYGDFNWVPGFGDDGIYHAIFVATDDSGAVSEDTVVLVINNINAPPQFDEIPFLFANENETFDFQISATDIDGTIPSISTDQLPVGASFVDNGNGTGTFNWTPDCSQSNEYSIRCYAADDSGLVDTSYIYLEVGEACDLQLTVVTSPCVSCSPPQFYTDILVSDNGFAIEFNKYLVESSIPENISISSARGDELYYDYDVKNKSLVIRSEFGQFVPIDTIYVTLNTGIYDLDESSLDSNYNLTYTVGPVVYPGDCNNNGVVDEVDVLSIGLFWNQAGPDRNVGGEYGPLDFFAQPAHFQEQGNGEWNPRNAIYADVDGSGMVDAYDLCGIAVNFAKNSYEFATPKGAEASPGTASLSGLGSQVLGEMRQALIECPESAPKARMLEAIENALRASTVILPTEIELHQNYPNPFNPSTTIEFFLPKAEYATLSIYNMLGQEVITLLDEKVEAGYKEVVWNGKDNSGHQVASGIYFYKLNTETKEIIKRMLLVK